MAWDGAIVIIGAGVIGLCAAYNLAKQYQGCDAVTRVLDAKDTVFAAASSYNTGFLHYDFNASFGEDPAALGKYSLELWESIATHEDQQFVADTGYRSPSFFPVKPSNGDGEEFLRSGSKPATRRAASR
jgi:glycine/D-amino acid oxidase-like deaminating enzyme